MPVRLYAAIVFSVQVLLQVQSASFRRQLTSDPCNSGNGACAKCILTSGFIGDTFNHCVFCGDSCVSKSLVDSKKCPQPISKCKWDGASASQCSELNWPLAPGSQVCAASVLDSRCSFSTTHSNAKKWCEDHGARLCDTNELSDDVAVGTGCKLDQKRVWTSNACEGGYITQAGASRGLAANPPQCESATSNFRARCCADQLSPAKNTQPLHKLTCEELGWPLAPGSPAVCANSEFANGVCITKANFQTAQSACWSLGARLCTVEELAFDEAKGSGCELDDNRIWTSSSCNFGAMTMLGSRGDDSEKATCDQLDEQFAVRCCADVKQAVKFLSCEQLEWQIRSGGVCSSAEISSVCSRPKSNADAEAVCNSVGARLCIAEELKAGAGIGSSCNVEKSRVWSGTACPGGFISLTGDGSSFKTEQCMFASEKLLPLCCAQSSKPGLSRARG